MISKPFLDLLLDTRDTSCLILSTIYYFLLFFYSREIIREIIVSYCARLFSDRKAKDDSQDEKDEKWRSKRISRRGELANLFIQPRANVIVASYLKRRNPNDSWIALYPIVDRNFHVRLPESLKERERERLGSRKSGRRFIAAIRARSDAYYRKTRRFAETKRGEACTRIT